MTVTVNGQNISTSDEELIVSESVDIYECEFEFDASWDGWDKTAKFEGSGVTKEMVLIDDKTSIPDEVIKEDGWMRVGVYGTRNAQVMPTIWGADVYVRHGTDPESIETTPTPSIYAQILNLANGAKQKADEVKEDWESVTAEASTLAAGSPASVSFDNNKFTFGIPQGPKGDTGATGAPGTTPAFSIGTVTTLETGQPASASVTGTAAQPVLNLGLPKGNKGDNGDVANIAPAYSASATYAVGDYCIYNSQLYRCTTAITTAEAWNAAHWTAVQLGDEVGDLKNALESITSDVKTLAVFNGTTSVCSVDAITLSQDGDSLEIEVFPEVSTDSYGYSFASNTNKTRISIGATTKGVAFRAADETWLYLGNTAFGAEKYHYVIKIEYASGNINFYVDGSLLNTYTGQKTIKIESFGKNNYWSFWKGKIGYIKHNNTLYKNVSELNGYSATDIAIVLPYGLLTEDQYNAIQSIQQKKLIIQSASNKVSIYVHLVDNLWGRFDIGHENNHSDEPYVDYWRINESYLCIRNDDQTFTETASKLVVGAENEMALSFSGMGDFTGGYHGDERIDLDSGCYVTFIVDGQEYSITDLVSLGTIECDEFSYREASQLFASYSYNANHLPIAKHTKMTRFKNKGFVTTNYIGIDLTGFDHDTIRIIQPFTGLFCIASAFASVAVSDIGTEYTATHPVSTTTLAEEMNVYSLRAKTYKNNNSCEMDSKLLHTNIDAYKNPPIDVDMMDRQTDLKYYSYLPINTDVATGDYFATESMITFDIHG